MIHPYAAICYRRTNQPSKCLAQYIFPVFETVIISMRLVRHTEDNESAGGRAGAGRGQTFRSELLAVSWMEIGKRWHVFSLNPLHARSPRPKWPSIRQPRVQSCK